MPPDTEKFQQKALNSTKFDTALNFVSAGRDNNRGRGRGRGRGTGLGPL